MCPTAFPPSEMFSGSFIQILYFQFIVASVIPRDLAIVQVTSQLNYRRYRRIAIKTLSSKHGTYDTEHIA